MRLLNVFTLRFSSVFFSNTPSYVIASHQWMRDESTFEELEKDLDKRNTNTSGYNKIVGFAEFVKLHLPHVEWIWIDTCCINKKDGPELSEAIISMCKWYREAEVCLAYLADVETIDDLSEFKQSDWFRRGWTLQELLAPRTVIFLTRAWNIIGHKGRTGRSISGIGIDSGPSLTTALVAASRVPESILDDFEKSSDFTVNERLVWMEGRVTTREEDMVYSLLGIFDVSIPVLYGEGSRRARARLLAEIYRSNGASRQEVQEQFPKIVGWLSAPDPWTNHAAAQHRHEAETGSWLLRSEQYWRWRSGLSRHLWLSGKAGCGKTILCSSVVEDVRAYCEVTANTTYAAFYFSFSDVRKQSHENLLRSLVAQLAWVEPGLSKLRQAHERLNASVPGPHELAEILQLSTRTYDKVFLLMDALDECPEGSTGDARQDVLHFLGRLVETASNIKIFVTSREVPDIRISMTLINAREMVVAGQVVDGDIRKYVSTQMSRASRLNRLSERLKTLVADTLAERADGMFRWAFCQLEELKKLKLTKPSQIEKALTTLPASLDETYERMLAGIDAGYRKEAVILLKWLAYARSPPSLGELAEVMVINPEDGTVDMDDRGSPEDTLDILSGLVTIIGNRYETADNKKDDSYSDNDGDDGYSDDDGDDGYSDDIDANNEHSTRQHRRRIDNKTKVRLAHYSVKEYLESKRIATSRVKQFGLTEAKGHQFLAQSCTTYIMHYSSSLKKTSTKKDLIAFPMLEYAARTWFYHSSLQQPGDVSREATLVCSESIKHNWLLVHRPDRSWKLPFTSVEDVGSGLYYASNVGLVAVVEELIRSEWNVNAQGGRFGNALQAASFNGYEKVVSMLLERGADVNAQGGDYSNALQAASFNGYEKVVSMLLERGADVNAQGGRFGNALQAASFNGYEKVVSMLLERGADVNAQGGDYSNALQAASLDGYEKVVSMLLERGADVNAQGGRFGNALQAASFNGYEKVVSMLLERGADVNAQGGDFGNALQAASLNGYEKVVSMLLERGADVNAQGGRFGNALQAASFNGHEKVVSMLLERGADVNAQGGNYGNALQAASLDGHEKVVSMVLERGADVNAQGGNYGNALQAASFNGHEKVVSTLLERGAEVNAQGGDFGNALQAASLNGYEKVVSMLLERGADVNAQGGDYGNALQAASLDGFEKVVSMLLERGADVNAQGGDYGNALQAASFNGHEKVVSTLLERGAEVNAQGGHFSNALQAALEDGHETVVQMLIDADPDINARGGGLRQCAAGGIIERL